MVRVTADVEIPIPLGREGQVTRIDGTSPIGEYTLGFAILAVTINGAIVGADHIQIAVRAKGKPPRLREASTSRSYKLAQVVPAGRIVLKHAVRARARDVELIDLILGILMKRQTIRPVKQALVCGV